MHNGVTNSKKQSAGACPQYFLRMAPCSVAWNGLFLLLPAFLVLQESFWPETFVECSMTNVLEKQKNWREMKFPFGWK